MVVEGVPLLVTPYMVSHKFVHALSVRKHHALVFLEITEDPNVHIRSTEPVDVDLARCAVFLVWKLLFVVEVLVLL